MTCVEGESPEYWGDGGILGQLNGSFGNCYFWVSDISKMWWLIAGAGLARIFKPNTVFDPGWTYLQPTQHGRESVEKQVWFYFSYNTGVVRTWRLTVRLEGVEIVGVPCFVWTSWDLIDSVLMASLCCRVPSVLVPFHLVPWSPASPADGSSLRVHHSHWASSGETPSLVPGLGRLFQESHVPVWAFAHAHSQNYFCFSTLMLWEHCSVGF